MAGKVKKGFGTYLFILFLMLIAAILIVLMVMIFSPFKKVMGYQYIYYHDEYFEYNVTGGSSNSIFDLSSLEEIKVNCNYATVSLERSKQADKNMIKITNAVNGFATAEANVDFSYKLYYEVGSEDKVLCIDVHEAEATTFFSKNVEVSIVLPDEASLDLSNVTLNITNTTGNVFVGAHSDAVTNINLAGLNVKTTSGGVYLGRLLNGNINDLFISSEKGSIQSLINLNTNTFAINSKTGKAEFQDVEVNGSVAIMNLGNCEFVAKNFVGNIELQIADGYLDMAKLVGDISGNNPAEQLTTPTITIKEVVGNVSFPFANASKIKIDKLSGGKLYVNGTNGHVSVGELHGYAWVELTSGSIDIKSYSDLELKTVSGKINVDYIADQITNRISMISESGEVSLSVKSVLKFTLNVCDAKGNVRTASNVKVEGFDNIFTLPLDINGGGKAIDITTNSKVAVDLYKVA